MPTVHYDSGVVLVVSGSIDVKEGLDGNTIIDMRGCRPVRIKPKMPYQRLNDKRITSIEKDAQDGLLSFRNPDLPLGVKDEVREVIRIGPKGELHVLMPIEPD